MHEIRDPAIRLFGQKIPFPEDVDIEEEEEEDESGDGKEEEKEEDKVWFVVCLGKLFSESKQRFFVTYTQHPFLLMLKPLMGPFCLFVFPLFAHITTTYLPTPLLFQSFHFYLNFYSPCCFSMENLYPSVNFSQLQLEIDLMKVPNLRNLLLIR